MDNHSWEGWPSGPDSEVGRAKTMSSAAIGRVRRCAIISCAVAASLTLALFHDFFRNKPPLLECSVLVAVVCAPYLAILGLARPRFYPGGPFAALVLSLVIGVPTVLILYSEVQPTSGNDPEMMNCGPPIVGFLFILAQWTVIGAAWIAFLIAHPRTKRERSRPGVRPSR